MPGLSSLKLTINFNDSDLSPEERNEQVQRLLAELKDMDEVETADRVLDPTPPEGNKALGGFLVGLLITGVNAANAKAAFGFLKDRLSGRLIELEIGVTGKRLKVSAHSREKLEAAITAAQGFIAA